MKKKSRPRRKPFDANIAALERIADALERNIRSNSGSCIGARSTIETKVRAAKGEERDLTAMLTFNELRDLLGRSSENPWRSDTASFS